MDFGGGKGKIFLVKSADGKQAKEIIGGIAVESECRRPGSAEKSQIQRGKIP